MTDFRPGDSMVPVIYNEKSVIGRVLLGVFLALAVAAGLIYQFRPEWVAGIMESPPVRNAVAALDDRPKTTDFSALYQKYGIPPLDAEAVATYAVNKQLVILMKEPCDNEIVYQAALALEQVHATRSAASLMKGFSDVCPDSSGERYRASELFYLSGEYQTAAKLSSDLINSQPDAQKPYFIRAKSEQSLQQYAAAVEDYATLIRLLPDAKYISSEVFTRMSDSYEKLDRPCEAIGPIQTYIALDSDKRSTTQLLGRMTALASKGNCTQTYAKGIARIPRRSSGVTTARVEINGIEGTFIVDTGASFVALSQRFADKAKPHLLSTEAVEMQTANGTTQAMLATVDSVKLAGLSASSVSAVVVSKGLGDGIDGLLGMSFLSRFTVMMQDRDIQLKAKTLAE